MMRLSLWSSTSVSAGASWLVIENVTGPALALVALSLQSPPLSLVRVTLTWAAPWLTWAVPAALVVADPEVELGVLELPQAVRPAAARARMPVGTAISAARRRLLDDMGIAP